MTGAAQLFTPSRPPLRGSPRRYTDLMQALQYGYLRSVAAANGCVVSGVPEIDEGTDILLSHTSVSHTAISDRIARLEIQMKATGGLPAPEAASVTATMLRDRYNLYETPDPSMHRVVVILAMPQDQADWVLSQPNALSVHHCAYWTNLAGEGPISNSSTTVHAPLTQPFDDIALCDMMERIGKGGAP